MARHPDFDVVILGGGLAGLSLAARLASLPPRRTLMIEPRREYRRDRTWCYWRLGPHPFRDAVSASWTSWEVLRPAAGGRAPDIAVQTSAALPYEMIPADRFYEVARAMVAAAPHIEVRTGCTASGLDERPDGVTIATSAGPVTANIVFDSRPPKGGGRDLAQRFLGQEVVTRQPVFEPGRVTLMDFAVPQQEGVIHFLYVLPTSRTTALVEDTWLAPADVPLPDYRGSIAAYLRERFGVENFTVEFEEEGAIPMNPALQAPSGAGRVIPIGTAGGAVKPSSGYGFLATQRMTDALAQDLAAGREPRPFQPRSGLARWMDEIFLSALRWSPAEAPRIFHSMFAGCPPEPLVRFLNDVGSPADTARVIAAMPKLPMVIAAAAHPWRGGAPA